MPTFTDVVQFLGGQFFGKTFIPHMDLSGQTMIVTGGNTGLGLDCAKHLSALSLLSFKALADLCIEPN